VARVQGYTEDDVDELAVTLADLLTAAAARAIERVIIAVTGPAAVVAAAGFTADDAAQITQRWQEEIAGASTAYLAEVHSGSAAQVALGLGEAFPQGINPGIEVLPSEFTQQYLAGAANQLKDVGNDVWEDARAQILEGVTAGESVQQIADRLRTVPGIARSTVERVARTSVHSAAEAGSIAQLRYMGFSGADTTKQWIYTHDNRTRPTHQGAPRGVGNTIVRLDESFTVGGWPMDHPGDYTAPASERERCRCTMVYDTEAPPRQEFRCGGLQSTIGNPRSSIGNPQSTIGEPESTIIEPSDLTAAASGGDCVTPGGSDAYQRMTVTALRRVARTRQLAGAQNLTKQELIDWLIGDDVDVWTNERAPQLRARAAQLRNLWTFAANAGQETSERALHTTVTTGVRQLGLDDARAARLMELGRGVLAGDPAARVSLLDELDTIALEGGLRRSTVRTGQLQLLDRATLEPFGAEGRIPSGAVVRVTEPGYSVVRPDGEVRQIQGRGQVIGTRAQAAREFPTEPILAPADVPLVTPPVAVSAPAPAPASTAVRAPRLTRAQQAAAAFDTQVSAAAQDQQALRAVPTAQQTIRSRQIRPRDSIRIEASIYDRETGYGGRGYVEINRGLETGKGNLGALSADVRQRVYDLDEALSLSATTKDAVLYRGVAQPELITGGRPLRVGSTFRSWGYSSTSVSRDAASDFARGRSAVAGERASQPTLLRLILPRGSQAMSLSDLQYPGVGEVLLPRGAVYKVIADRGVVNGVRQLDVAISFPERIATRAEIEAAAEQATATAREFLAAHPAATPAQLRSAGITRVVSKTKTVAYDPALYDARGVKIPAGAKVRIVEPGYTLSVRGETVELSKPVVEAVTPKITMATPVDIQALLVANNPVIEAALRDVYEGRFGPYTTKVQVHITRGGTRVNRRGMSHQVEPSIGIDGKIYNSAGLEIGYFSRSISPTTLHYTDGTVRREIWAEHHIVQLEPKYQAKGFGGPFNRRAIDWYRQSGVHGVSLSDHNGYVWASQGFDFAGGIVPESTIQALRDTIADLRAGKIADQYGVKYPKALREAGDLSAQLAAADNILVRLASVRPGQPGYPTAYEISQVGRTTQRGKTSTWLGKHFMFNHGSTSQLILNPDEGVVLNR
jgi:ADP-ribosyltransferase exoenzyme/Phage Mu protein F like protein